VSIAEQTDRNEPILGDMMSDICIGKKLFDGKSPDGRHVFAIELPAIERGTGTPGVAYHLFVQDRVTGRYVRRRFTELDEVQDRVNTYGVDCRTAEQ